MQITTTHLKRCDILALSGRFDSNTSPELDRALQAVMAAGTYRIVLDMTGVEYFGSAAIRALVAAYKECRKHNRGGVHLSGVPERIAKVLELAGIMPLINSYPDNVQAVGDF